MNLILPQSVISSRYPVETDKKETNLRETEAYWGVEILDEDRMQW